MDCDEIAIHRHAVDRGGENISPREVEEYLYRHPAIRDVQVIGVPDPKYGEELCAWIVLRTGAQAGARVMKFRGRCKNARSAEPFQQARNRSVENVMTKP